MESFVCFWSRRTGRRTVAGGGGRARGMREAPLAVRIRHRDRRTRGTTLSLQGPHGGDTANTILNNPAGRTDRHRVRDGSGAPLAPRTPHQEKELVFLLSCFQQTPGLGWETHGNWSGRTDILFERLRVQLGRMTGTKGANVPAGPHPKSKPQPRSLGFPARSSPAHTLADAPKPRGSPSVPPCRVCA